MWRWRDHPTRKVGLRLCSDKASSSKRRTSGEGEGTASETHSGFSILQMVRQNAWATIPTLVEIERGELDQKLPAPSRTTDRP